MLATISLTYAKQSGSQHEFPCEIRHLAYTAKFTTDVRFVNGTLNAAADALSRMSSSAITTRVSDFFFAAFETVQEDNNKLTTFPPITSLQLRDVPFPVTLTCDMFAPRLYVPNYALGSYFLGS